MVSRLWCSAAVVLVLTQFLAVPCAVGLERPRLDRVDDYYEDEDIVREAIVFSPDGQSVAFNKRRPAKTMPGSLKNGLVIDDFRGDVWLQDLAGRPARNLTNGASDSSGWWAPQWSPDGQWLAFLSTRGGYVTLWVWERAANQVRQVSKQGLDFNAKSGRGLPYEWADGNRLVFLAPPDGEASLPVSWAGRAVGLVRSAWERAAKGEATGSAVDSTTFVYPARDLLALDVTSGKRTLVGRTWNSVWSPSWWVSPDGKAAALVRPFPATYSNPSQMRLGYPRQVELFFLTGQPVKLDKPLPDNVLASTLQWSPDGKELGFFAYGDRPINPLVLYGTAAAEVMPDFVWSLGMSLENPARLYRVNLHQGRVEQLDSGDIDKGYLSAPTLTWTAAGELLFHAPRQTYGAATLNPIPRRGNTANIIGPQAKLEWLVLSRNGQTRPLAAGIGTSLDSVQPIAGGKWFLGVSDGDLWRIDAAGGRVENLTAEFSPRVLRLEKQDDVEDDVPAHVVLLAGTLTERDRVLLSAGLTPYVSTSDYGYYLLNLATGAATPLDTPAPNASVMAIGRDAVSLIHYADDQSGTYLWRRTGSGTFDTLVEANSYRRSIRAGETKVFDFTTLNGEKLKAAVVLPIDYKPGRKYPLWVEVRSGATVREFDFSNSLRRRHGPTELPAAAGYVCMVVSMPDNLPGMVKEEGISVLAQSNAVMAAVDKAIDLGIADPDRLFLSGGSKGAWTAVSILGLTTRFKAAAVAAGPYRDVQTFGSNGGSLTHTIHDRYSNTPHDQALPTAFFTGYHPTDVPWWRDGDRVRRNSPITYADRIQTPLMIMHGDLDNVPFEQAEDMFMAMASMRKRAQLVRYWGEGHIILTPANQRDKWQRKFAWFDDFGDISRDSNGNMIFEGDHVKSRHGAPALTPADFAKFGPAAPAPWASFASHQE